MLLILTILIGYCILCVTQHLPAKWYVNHIVSQKNTYKMHKTIVRHDGSLTTPHTLCDSAFASRVVDCVLERHTLAAQNHSKT